MSIVRRGKLDSAFDGARLTALFADAQAPKKGGVVIAQEIFGLSAHIEELCVTFAEAGYDVIAPGLFDRIEADFSAEQDSQGYAKGRDAVLATPWAQAVGDMQSAIDALPAPRFVVGFCYGGAVAWRAAGECRDLTAASCFYGRLIVTMLDITPRVPVMLHYGLRDTSIPRADVEQVRNAHSRALIYSYDAGHGFCRAASADYDQPSRVVAIRRTLEFFEREHPTKSLE